MSKSNAENLDRTLAKTYWDTAIAILDGVLQQEGHKKLLAIDLGVTPARVSQFFTVGRWDLPAREYFDKVLALPFEPEVRKQLAEYYELAHEDAIRVTNASPKGPIERGQSQILLNELHQAINHANSSHIPAQRISLRNEIFRKGILILAQLNPFTNIYLTSDFVEACLLLSHLSLQQNLPAQAYWYAQLAQRVLDRNKERHAILSDQRTIEFDLMTRHTQVNVLHHLGAYREAERIYKIVDKLDAFDYYGGVWLPRFYRDRIATALRIKRYPLSELIGFAIKANKVINQRGGDQSLKILVDRALTSVFIKHKKFKQARRLLAEHFDYVETNLNLDPLIRTMYYRTYAQLEWEYGREDNQMWKYTTSQALEIASTNGFEGQIAGIRRNFRDAVDQERPEIR